jgi:hypothetical protein
MLDPDQLVWLHWASEDLGPVGKVSTHHALPPTGVRLTIYAISPNSESGSNTVATSQRALEGVHRGFICNELNINCLD